MSPETRRSKLPAFQDNNEKQWLSYAFGCHSEARVSFRVKALYFCLGLHVHDELDVEKVGLAHDRTVLPYKNGLHSGG